MYEPFNSHQTALLQEAVPVIIQYANPVAVWCFGVRTKSDKCTGSLFLNTGKCKTVHLYLLVFTAGPTPVSIAKIQEAIAKKSAGLVTATVLVYQTSRLSRIKGNHRGFLKEILDNADCLYRKEGYAIPEFVTVKINNSAKIDYWNHCRYMAICCLEAETAIENPNAEPMQAVLLHQAAEQLCLGLIYVFLGCRPGYHALDYLLDICELFLPQVTDLLPRASQEEKSRFMVLSLRMESLRYRIKHPSITDIEVLRARVHALLEISTHAVEARLTNN